MAIGQRPGPMREINEIFVEATEMKICRDLHEPITYSSEECPLCEERKCQAAQLNKIVEVVTEFRDSIPVMGIPSTRQ